MSRKPQVVFRKTYVEFFRCFDSTSPILRWDFKVFFDACVPIDRWMYLSQISSLNLQLSGSPVDQMFLLHNYRFRVWIILYVPDSKIWNGCKITCRTTESTKKILSLPIPILTVFPTLIYIIINCNLSYPQVICMLDGWNLTFTNLLPRFLKFTISFYKCYFSNVFHFDLKLLPILNINAKY